MAMDERTYETYELEHSDTYGFSGTVSRSTFHTLLDYFGMTCTPVLVSGQDDDISPFMGQRGVTRDTRDLEDPGAVSEFISGRVQKKEPRPLGKSGEKARGLVCNFCHGYTTKVVPSESELCGLLTTCEGLSKKAVARAFCESLSWATGNLDWQPRLRALHALKFFAEAPGKGAAIAKKTAKDSVNILEHLRDDVPQCSNMARTVLVLADE